MVYLDTSFVVPLVIAEDTSEAVEAAILKLAPGELATSAWTRVELASLISRKVRMGELSDAEAHVARREFEQLLGESFEVLVPTAADFIAAGKYLEVPRTGLRAGDALHLAIAATSGVRNILSLDQGFLEAGRRLKLPVSRGIRS